MEEYLQYMKTLRIQINDAEDHAAKISVEEQIQLTTIQTLEKDIDTAKSKTRQLREDTEQMNKSKGLICSQILENQRKIASLESDSSTLAQTLELIQQERIGLSAKLVEKRTYYNKVAEETNAKFQQQQDWFSSRKIIRGELREQVIVKDIVDNHTHESEGLSAASDNLMMVEPGCNPRNSLMTKLDAAKGKLDDILSKKSKLLNETNKLKQLIREANCKEDDFKPELKTMDLKILEEEHEALLSEKAGEIVHLQSLQEQIEQLKGISDIVKCTCGDEYKVELSL